MTDLTIDSLGMVCEATDFTAGLSSTNSLTDLNVVWQKVFAGITDSIQRDKIILRCDELPWVAADEEAMQRLFYQLGQMIIVCSTPDSQLFIYVKSKVARKEDLHSYLAPDDQYVVTSIYSNANNCTEWEMQQEGILNDCNVLCKSANGAFSYLPSGQHGVLFSIILPGKLNTHSLG